MYIDILSHTYLFIHISKYECNIHVKHVWSRDTLAIFHSLILRRRSSCSKTGWFWLRNMTIQLSNELNPIFPFPTTLLGTLAPKRPRMRQVIGPRRHLSWGTSPTFALMLCYVQNDVKHRFYGRVSPLLVGSNGDSPSCRALN